MEEVPLLQKPPGVSTWLTRSLSQNKRQAKTPARLTLGEVPLTLVPQTGALRQQVPDSLGDDAVLAVRRSTSFHQTAVSKARVPHPESAKDDLLPTRERGGVDPGGEHRGNSPELVLHRGRLPPPMPNIAGRPLDKRFEVFGS